MTALNTILLANRSRYNALFAQSKRLKPALDMEIFSSHLRDEVAPVVEAVAAIAPDRLEHVVDALYQASLELVGTDLLGSRSRYPELVTGWTRTLIGLARHLAAEPGPLVSAVSNALYNLVTVPGARADDWVEAMINAASVSNDIETLLQVGKVAAWRAGLAHYRLSALAACRTLSLPQAQRALGIPDEIVIPDLSRLIDDLEADPWLDPATVGTDAEPTAVRALSIGAFRGYGGIFRRPPTVKCIGDELYVGDGDDIWLLFADAFGHTLHRAGQLASNETPSIAGPFRIGSDNKAYFRDQELPFLNAPEFSSIAFSSTTLAATRHLSHHLFLLVPARRGTRDGEITLDLQSQ